MLLRFEERVTIDGEVDGVMDKEASDEEDLTQSEAHD